MIRCQPCGSYAINDRAHGREAGVDLDLCDVCYWRKRAAARPFVTAMNELAGSKADAVAGSAASASSCCADNGGAWYDIEDAPQDGTIIVGATYDRRHIGAICMGYCDGDMEGAWVTERSHSLIRWNPQCWTIVPATPLVWS